MKSAPVTSARRKGAKRLLANHQPALSELGKTRSPKRRSSCAIAPNGT